LQAAIKQEKATSLLFGRIRLRFPGFFPINHEIFRKSKLAVLQNSVLLSNKMQIFYKMLANIKKNIILIDSLK